MGMETTLFNRFIYGLYACRGVKSGFKKDAGLLLIFSPMYIEVIEIGFGDYVIKNTTRHIIISLIFYLTYNMISLIIICVLGILRVKLTRHIWLLRYGFFQTSWKEESALCQSVKSYLLRN